MNTPSVTGSSGAQTGSPATKAADPLSDKNTFLQLLVTQLKNQDPLQPQDGVQFLSQLAQFSQLEQTTQLHDDLSAIQSSIDRLVVAASKTGANG